MTTDLAKVKRLVIVCLLVATGAVASGCAAVGLIAHATTPPPKMPAMCRLQPVPTIVLVDFASNPGQSPTDTYRIAQMMTGIMRGNGVTQLVDPGMALQAHSQAALGTRLKPSEVARASGAKQFVYVDVRRYGTTSSVAGEASDGEAEAAVWLVDADTAQVLWPPETGQGFPIGASVPFTPTAGGTTEQAIRDQLNQQIALKAARLFFDWQEAE